MCLKPRPPLSLTPWAQAPSVLLSLKSHGPSAFSMHKLRPFLQHIRGRFGRIWKSRHPKYDWLCPRGGAHRCTHDTHLYTLVLGETTRIHTKAFITGLVGCEGVEQRHDYITAIIGRDNLHQRGDKTLFRCCIEVNRNGKCRPIDTHRSFILAPFPGCSQKTTECTHMHTHTCTHLMIHIRLSMQVRQEMVHSGQY